LAQQINDPADRCATQQNYRDNFPIHDPSSVTLHLHRNAPPALRLYAIYASDRRVLADVAKWERGEGPSDTSFGAQRNFIACPVLLIINGIIS
jgi:hypothetical protein